MTEQPDLPPSDDPRPAHPFQDLTARRMFDMVKTPITLLVLLALLTFGGWWGWTTFNADSAGPAPANCLMQDVGPSVKPGHVTVRVYNGGTKRGLARTVSASLRTAGFIVDLPENSKDRIGVTVIKGNNVKSPEVLLVAGFFPGAQIVGDNRPDHVVSVYVGNKFTEVKADAPKEVPVQGGKACLPPIPTPTPAPGK